MRDQNWFAIGIDFTIVVFGVFIGLQVANWNEQRQLRLSDNALLERLQGDFEYIVAGANLRGPLIREQPVLTGHLINALRADESLILSDETERWLVAALNSWISLPIPPSYDEAVDTGMLSRISDLELKEALTRYASFIGIDHEIVRKQLELSNSGVLDAFIELKTNNLIQDDFEVESVDWEKARQSLPHLQTILKT